MTWLNMLDGKATIGHGFKTNEVQEAAMVNQDKETRALRSAQKKTTGKMQQPGKISLPSFSEAPETREVDEYCQEHDYRYRSTQCLFNGSWVGTPCPRCERQEEDEIRHAEERKRRVASQLAALKAAGIPKRFRDKNFESYRHNSDEQYKAMDVCKKYAENFKASYEHGVCLTMCGKPGTGKTHLACSVGNHLVERGHSVVFIGALDIVGRIKETWGKGATETEREVVNRFVELDLLIIDEVGVQFGKESEQIILFKILNRRYEEVKPTIVISNLMGNELDNYLGERVVDRLKENGGPTLAFDWNSWRTKGGV